MSKGVDVAAAVAALLKDKSKKAPATVTDGFPDQDDPVAVLVQSFLLWDADTEKAVAAYAKLREEYVDFNELRVSMGNDVAAIIGTRYPNVEERCRRLRSVLRAVWLREHSMKVEAGVAGGKRQLRRYVETLDGIVPYVAERTLLVAFGVHALPVDESLRGRLEEAGILAESDDTAAASSLMLKHVKAADALSAHLALQAWIDEVGALPPKKAPKKTAPKKTASKKTASKKTSTKKTTTKAAEATKTASKKTASKKTASKKTASKKTATKKTTTKKTASKKTASKKTASKKTASKKTASKKTTSKKKTTRSKTSAGS